MNSWASKCFTLKYSRQFNLIFQKTMLPENLFNFPKHPYTESGMCGSKSFTFKKLPVPCVAALACQSFIILYIVCQCMFKCIEKKSNLQVLKVGIFCWNYKRMFKLQIFCVFCVIFFREKKIHSTHAFLFYKFYSALHICYHQKARFRTGSRLKSAAHESCQDSATVVHADNIHLLSYYTVTSSA